MQKEGDSNFLSKDKRKVMQDSFMNPPRKELTQISEQEREIINDIRRIDFGKIVVHVQDGVIVSKEVTVITKNNKNKNNNFTKYNSDRLEASRI